MLFKYKGFEYDFEEDIEENENRKIIHFMKKPTGTYEQMDFSPYSEMTEESFKMMVELENPDRLKRMSSPWDHESIKKEFLKVE